MRRKTLVVLVPLTCIVASLVVIPSFMPAQPGSKGAVLKPAGDVSQPGAPANNSDALPVSKVILYTSGVGYFQREGQVEGDARIDLSFPVGEINDLLKSLVLRDLNGGTISTVSYDSHDPIAKSLKSFAVNLSGNPSFADILNQMRGEKMTVLWQPPQTQQTSVAGANMGVEIRKQPVNKEVADVEYINVWNDKGMQSIKLTEVLQIHCQNPALNNEVNRALQMVAQGHDKQKKGTSLLFSGKGKRTVQVGYVIEHPIWRTSYRLVLSKEKQPFLQGWALVENPSNEDWKEVNLSLVSGHPVSFRMNLYQPLYVERPLVKLQLFQDLKPTAYGGEMESLKMPAVPPMLREKREVEGTDHRPILERPAPAPPPVAGEFAGRIQQSTPTQAQGVKLGDQFQYVMTQPISVAGQKSALVPIVNADVKGTKVSIYNEQNLAKFPMLGLKFKNTTPFHLMQGPITVFAEDSYAGDAIISDIQPGEERLLSYAVDSAIEVKTESKREPEARVKYAIIKGIVHKTVIMRETKTYIAKNRSAEDKLVIFEHPIRAPEYTLVTPAKAPSQSETYYRFEEKVPPGASKAFPVAEERKVLEEIILTGANDQTLVFLQKNSSASPAMKEALQKAIHLKLKLAKTQADIAQLQNKIKIIAEDQSRQRENMKVIPQTNPVYKTYLDKFLKQEDQIDRDRAQIEQLQATANQQRQAYEEFVLSLTIEDR